MEILTQYLPLCWFKNNPLELDRSVSFFQKNLYFYILIELFIQTNVTDPVEAFLEVAMETTLTLLFVASMLYFKKAMAGYIPAATSFLFCENIIACFGLPIITWLSTTDDAWSYYSLFALFTWDVAIITHLIKEILLTNFFKALLLSILYFFITYLGPFAVMNLI